MIRLLNPDGTINNLAVSDFVDRTPRALDQVSRLNLFKKRGITERSVQIGIKEGEIVLIPTLPYGAPPYQDVTKAKKLRTIGVPRLAISGTINASQLQGMATWQESGQGYDLVTQSFESALRDLTDDKTGKIDATISHLELGALKGVLLDADAETVVEDLFLALGVTQTVVDFDLATTTSEPREFCRKVRMAITKGLNGKTRTGVRGFVGEGFFDALMTHPEVKKAYTGVDQNSFLRGENQEDVIRFGGIDFELMTTEINGNKLIGENEANFFPEGADIYREVFSPADFIDAVNLPGKPRYIQAEELPKKRGYSADFESCPLPYVTNVEALVKGTV